MMEKTTGSFLDPCASLCWSDFPSLPFAHSGYAESKVQAVYVPDDRNGRLYVALVPENKFCFCTFGDNPTWHSDLDLPRGTIHDIVDPDLLDLPTLHDVIQICDYTLTVYGSKLVVIGGTLLGIPSNLVWSLSSMENKWKRLPPMPTRRSSVAAVSYDNHLVAAGGKCGDKVCHKVEVFNGDKWTKVKQFPYPKSPIELTSVLHADKRWYIMETNGGEARATYSTPIEDIISDSPTYEWKEHSPESCPPSGRLPPISFDGQLIVVGNNGNYKKAKLYFHSPVTGSWVSFENAPYIGQCCNVVGVASLSHKALIMIYNGSLPTKKYPIKMVIHQADLQHCVLDQCFSLSALIKLEYGHNIRVLSQLTPFNLRQMKQKAVFNLKPLDDEEKRMGTSDPTVNIYIESWLKESDENNGCRPTWRNLLVILRDIGMIEVAEKICWLLSKFSVTITASSGVILETLLKLQGSLSSVKHNCESSEIDEESQRMILPVMDRSLTDSYSIAWVARNTKVKAMTRNEILVQENRALLKRVNELQRKALDEKLTAEEHLGKLKTQLQQISLQMQNQAYREIKEIKNDVDQCVKMCDIVKTKLADEMKLLRDHTQQLKDQSHHGSAAAGGEATDSTQLKEQHIPCLLQQLMKHAANWREIGICLGFLPSELRNIAAQPYLMQSATLSYFEAMLSQWVQWAPGDSRGSTNFAYLEDLKSALNQAGFGATAHELKV